MLHAILGASSAERWMNCTASPLLIQTLDPEERDSTSSYAEEGSAAHGLGEMLASQYAQTRTYQDPKSFIGRKMGRVLGGDYELLDVNDLTGTGIFCYEIDEEMATSVQAYMTEIEQWVDQLVEPVIYVEQSVQPVIGREDLFGTSDCIIVDTVMGVIIVIDLKYGRGKIVQAEANPQAQYYALGALQKAIMDLPEAESAAITEAILVICQPRVVFPDGKSRSEWPITRKALESWGETMVTAADMTYTDDAIFQDGDWCGFCPAKAICPLMRGSALRAAQTAFTENPLSLEIDEMHTVEMILPDADDPEAVVRALKLASLMGDWAKAVHARAFHLAQNGVRIPGQKLVRKKTHRRWADGEKVEKVLRNKGGIKKADTHTEKLKSPAALEKVDGLGKKWVAKYAEKPEGALTLAPESDRRKAEVPAIAAFASAPSDDGFSDLL